MLLPVDFLGEDFRLSNHQFEVFAAHHFDEDSELQFSASHHFMSIGTAVLHHFDGDVGKQFFLKTLAKIARGDELPFHSGERGGIHREAHGDSGFVDLNMRQRARSFGAGNGLADGDALHSRDGENIARAAQRFVDTLQTFERIHLCDFGFVQ